MQFIITLRIVKYLTNLQIDRSKVINSAKCIQILQ